MSVRRHLGQLPRVVVTETLATLRSASFPLARLRRLPTRSDVGRPVVLVHGYLGHADMFRPLQRRMHAAGLENVRCVSYRSTRLSLDEIASAIDEVVVPLARAFGPVDLVGHSLGAVACRAWLKAFGGAPWVRRFVSLGGPHAGTALYRLTPPLLWEVLDPDGPWVRALADGPEPVPTTVIRSRYDHQILPPVRASLPGAIEVVLDGHGHNGLLWSRTAHRAVIDALTSTT